MLLSNAFAIRSIGIPAIQCRERRTRCVSIFNEIKMKPNKPILGTQIAVLFIIIAVISDISSITDAASLEDDQTAIELGHKIFAVMEAIQKPMAPNSMNAVIELGRDQRFYVMVRGWLSYQLEGDRSILDAAKGQTNDRVRERILFLEKAIRAIDNE